jgi:hypothetical protein
MHYHAVMKQPHFPRATNDKFFVVIEARDPLYDPAATKALLEKVGGREIVELED